MCSKIVSFGTGSCGSWSREFVEGAFMAAEEAASLPQLTIFFLMEFLGARKLCDGKPKQSPYYKGFHGRMLGICTRYWKPGSN